MICLYVKIIDNCMYLIIQDEFWIVHIPYGSIVKF